MANKLSSTEAAKADVIVDEKGAQRSVPAKTPGASSSARQRPEPTRRKKVANAAQHPEPTSKSATSKNTKAELILKKLRTAKGASIEVLIDETGWQAHSVRGFLSAVVKKKLAFNLVSERGKDGVRRYRIDGDTKSA